MSMYFMAVSPVGVPVRGRRGGAFEE